MSEPGAMVFVVDDEARTCESLKNLIRSVGLHVSWCPSSLRLNTRGLPGERHRGKTALPIGPSWPPSSPLTPGDALDAGRVGIRHLCRPPASDGPWHVLTMPVDVRPCLF